MPKAANAALGGDDEHVDPASDADAGTTTVPEDAHTTDQDSDSEAVPETEPAPIEVEHASNVSDAKRVMTVDGPDHHHYAIGVRDPANWNQFFIMQISRAARDSDADTLLASQLDMFDDIIFKEDHPLLYEVLRKYGPDALGQMDDDTTPIGKALKMVDPKGPGRLRQR